MFVSRKEYQSPKNGAIVVDRFFFSTPSVIVNQCLQSGPYITAMWKNAFGKIPKEFIPKKVLLLGLGGGDVVRILQRKYPDTSITVIEWDEVMITIAKELGTFSLGDNVRILHGDAFLLLPTLQESFDMIIVDLFTGEIPPMELTEQTTCSLLKSKLSIDGSMFANFFRHEKYLDAFQDSFREELTWKFKQNILVLYRHYDN